MTPAGERGFRTVEEAEASARKREMKSFVVVKNSLQPFMQPEFAWISPVGFYINRSIPAAMAGIALVKTVTE